MLQPSTRFGLEVGRRCSQLAAALAQPVQNLSRSSRHSKTSRPEKAWRPHRSTCRSSWLALGRWVAAATRSSITCGAHKGRGRPAHLLAPGRAASSNEGRSSEDQRGGRPMVVHSGESRLALESVGRCCPGWRRRLTFSIGSLSFSRKVPELRGAAGRGQNSRALTA